MEQQDIPGVRCFPPAGSSAGGVRAAADTVHCRGGRRGDLRMAERRAARSCAQNARLQRVRMEQGSGRKSTAGWETIRSSTRNSPDISGKGETHMSRGDRTGPAGWGPMSGRAAGWCAGHHGPGYADPFAGLAVGSGRRSGRDFRGAGSGGGRGWRNWFRSTGRPGWARFGGGVPYAPEATLPEAEKRYLEEQADGLEDRLEEIRHRLDELSGRETPKQE